MKMADLVMRVTTVLLAIMVVIVMITAVVFRYEEEGQIMDCMPPLTEEEEQKCTEARKNGLNIVE